MKHLSAGLALALFLFAAAATTAHAQNPTRAIRQGASLPATCGVGEVFVKNSVTPKEIYLCTTTNTWAQVYAAGTGSATAAPSPAIAALSDGATVNWPFGGNESRAATLTIGGNRALAFSGTSAGATGVLFLKEDATGGWTPTLPAGSIVVGTTGGTTLSGLITTTANAVNVLSFFYDGTNYHWFVNAYTGQGGVSGLTTGTIPKASSGTALADSPLTVSGTTVATTGDIKVSRVVNNTNATPSTPSATGHGTTGQSVAMDTGSTDRAGIITITGGTVGATATGTATLNFSAAYGTNNPVCTCTLMNGTGSWNVRATAIINSASTTAVVINWDNNAVTLANSTYKIAYHCTGK